MKESSPRFMLTGGGTGGHVTPALAIADELKCRHPDASFLYVGMRGKAEEELGVKPPEFDMALAALLTMDPEIDIIKRMMELPQTVEDAASTRQPHRIAAYLLELSRRFQSYYTQTKNDPIIPPASKRAEGLDDWDWGRTKARLMAVEALRSVFANCLHLLGLSAPERMASLDERQGEEEEEV